jgi:hypothetical protein
VCMPVKGFVICVVFHGVIDKRGVIRASPRALSTHKFWVRRGRVLRIVAELYRCDSIKRIERRFAERARAESVST